MGCAKILRYLLRGFSDDLDTADEGTSQRLVGRERLGRR